MAVMSHILSARVPRPEPSGAAACAFPALEHLLVLRTPGLSAGGSGVPVAWAGCL